MNMKNKSKLNNKKGLTLIELLAVLVVLAIITAIALPFYLKDKQKVDSFTLEMKEKEMSKAIDSWYQANEQIPIVGQNITFDQLKSQCAVDINNFSLVQNICQLDLTPLLTTKKINFTTSGDIYYIYYTVSNNSYNITNDYPIDYIKALIEKYKVSSSGNVYPMVGTSDVIDQSKLISAGLLSQKSKFKYVLLKNNLVDRITNQN